jgi:molybdopterin-biosynthesis enzyme MoeA-like protein
MAETKQAKSGNPLDALPTAKDLMKQIGLREAEKASAALKAQTAEEAEKKALMEKFTKASGVSDAERMKRAAAIIQRAANNGLTEVFIVRFPNKLCTDHGRAINQQEAGWEKTLTGLPKELYEFWQQHLKPRGYKLKCQIVDFPGGMPGDVGITLSWS